MKSWQILFRQQPAGDGAQGGSTGDEDFDDAADDALVAEGEEELDSDDGEEEETESEEEEEQSDEDQDLLDEEEEEEVDSEEEEDAAPAGFKFKDPKTGDFDFKRINKVVGGPELEKAFKEQSATITRTFQENKELKEQLNSPELAERGNKAGFFDHLMQTHPGIREEVIRILHGDQAGQAQPQAGKLEIPGINPDDPLLPVVQELMTGYRTLQNRLQGEDQQRQAQEADRRFVEGLRGARAKFKELTGAEPTEEQLTLVAKEMKKTSFLNGARLVPDLFMDLVRKAERQKYLESRKAKKNLPKVGSTSRRAAPTKTRRSREEEFESLWEEHMGSED